VKEGGGRERRITFRCHLVAGKHGSLWWREYMRRLVKKMIQNFKSFFLVWTFVEGMEPTPGCEDGSATGEAACATGDRRSSHAFR